MPEIKSETARASADADILVLTSSFPRFAGDMSAPYLLDLCKVLQSSGRKPLSVLFPGDSESCLSEQEPESLQCFRFDYLPERKLQTLAFGAGIPDNLMRHPLRIFQVPAFLSGFYRKAAQLFHAADLVHAHWLLPAGWIGARLKARNPALKLVVSVHSSDLWLLRHMPFGKKIFRGIFAAADHITAVSGAQILLMSEMLGKKFNAEKISLIPMGVHCGSSAALEPERLRTILFLGRIVPIKGLPYLLEAAAGLPDSRLLIAGDGPEKKALARRFPEANFLGHLDEDGKAAVFRKAGIAVFPSVSEPWRREGLPVALLEAMAAGLAVIVTDTGGMKEAVRHGVNGLIVPEKKSRAIRQAVQHLQSNPGFAAKLGRAARETAMNFDWSRIAEKFRCVYDRVLEPKPPALVP